MPKLTDSHRSISRQTFTSTSILTPTKTIIFHSNTSKSSKVKRAYQPIIATIKPATMQPSAVFALVSLCLAQTVYAACETRTVSCV